MMKQMVVTDCEHVSYEQELAVCAERGLEFVRLDLRDKSEDEAAAALRGIPVVGNQYLRFTGSLLRRLPELKCIVRYGMGVDNIDIDAATQCGVAVCNVPDYSIREVASHGFALMMALTRKLKQMDALVSAGQWDYSPAIPLLRYTEMTVGVVGFGRIGRMFLEMARGLGCRVVAYDMLFPPTLTAEERERYRIPAYVELLTLDAVLAQSHVISLHVPMCKENGGFIQKARLEKMRPDAVLINVSRGGLVNEADLYEALVNRTIAGAACDTWETEPVRRDNPLLQLDNFIGTPHMAWYSEQASQDLKRKLAEECARALWGEPLRYQLNRQ